MKTFEVLCVLCVMIGTGRATHNNAGLTFVSGIFAIIALSYAPALFQKARNLLR